MIENEEALRLAYWLSSVSPGNLMAAAELRRQHEAIKALEAERDALRADDRVLRRMLAVRVAGALLYTDDGEMQDSTDFPLIDFYRDSPKEIQNKIWQRMRKNHLRIFEEEVARNAKLPEV